MFDVRHNWTIQDVYNAEVRRLNKKEKITMTGIYSIIASIGVLLFFPKVSSEISHPALNMRERSLHRQVTIAKIKKKKTDFYSSGFLKGPSKKLKGIPKDRILKILRKKSNRKVLK